MTSGIWYLHAQACSSSAGCKHRPEGAQQAGESHESRALARGASGAGSHTCRGTGVYTPALWPHWFDARANGLGAARQSSTYGVAVRWCLVLMWA
jgi:hypothetical protein